MHKICSVCEESKPEEDYSRQTSYTSGRRSMCKVCQRLANNVWRQKNPRASSDYYRQKRMGVSPSQYDEIVARQGNICAICDKEFGKGRMGKHLDHDHVSGKVRELLCGSCNVGLGAFEDNPNSLRMAALYLEAHKEIARSA